MTLRIAYLGTYDPGYSRNRVLIDGLRAAGAEVFEYAAPLDASLTAAQMTTTAGAGKLAGELARAHLSLLLRHRAGSRTTSSWSAIRATCSCRSPGRWRATTAPRWSSTRWSRCSIPSRATASCWPATAPPGIWPTSSTGSRSPCPTSCWPTPQAHADYYAGVLGVPPAKLAVVPVGALPLPGATGAARETTAAEPLRVVQYGRWSPLHGLPAVLDAADRAARRASALRAHRRRPARGVARRRGPGRRLDAVELTEALPVWRLRARVIAADVCLGVFGTSGKAARVVPNKVYDALAAGRPLVTEDSPAARELLTDGHDALLVPAGDGAALAAALRRLADRDERARLGAAALDLYRRRCTPEAVAATLLAALEACL